MTDRIRYYTTEFTEKEARILPALAYAVYEIVEPPYPMLATRTCVAWCHTEHDACRIRDAMQSRHATPTPAAHGYNVLADCARIAG